MRQARRGVLRIAGLLGLLIPLLVVLGGVVLARPASAASVAPPCPSGQPPARPPGQPPPGTLPPGRPTSYPIGQCQLLLSTGVIPAGGSLTVTGTGFAGDSSVAISMNPGSIALASTTTGANGQFSLVLTIPSSTPAGTYQVVATGLGADGSEQALVAQLTVTARGSTSRGSPTTSGGSPVSSGSSPGPSSAGRPGAGVGSGGSPATSKGGVAPKGGGAPSAANPIAATVTPTPPWSWETTAIVFASLLFVLGGTTLVLWSKRRRRLSGS